MILGCERVNGGHDPSMAVGHHSIIHQPAIQFHQRYTGHMHKEICVRACSCKYTNQTCKLVDLHSWLYTNINHRLAQSSVTIKEKDRARQWDEERCTQLFNEARAQNAEFESFYVVLKKKNSVSL